MKLARLSSATPKAAAGGPYVAPWQPRSSPSTTLRPDLLPWSSHHHRANTSLPNPATTADGIIGDSSCDANSATCAAHRYSTVIPPQFLPTRRHRFLPPPPSTASLRRPLQHGGRRLQPGPGGPEARKDGPQKSRSHLQGDCVAGTCRHFRCRDPRVRASSNQLGPAVQG